MSEKPTFASYDHRHVLDTRKSSLSIWNRKSSLKDDFSFAETGNHEAPYVIMKGNVHLKPQRNWRLTDMKGLQSERKSENPLLSWDLWAHKTMGTGFYWNDKLSTGSTSSLAISVKNFIVENQRQVKRGVRRSIEPMKLRVKNHAETVNNKMIDLWKWFIDFLPQEQRNFYCEKRVFRELFQEISETNVCFSESVETVNCYRPELAQTLMHLSSTYNIIYQKMLTLTKKYSDQGNSLL